MRMKKTIGILTDPSKSFKVPSRNRILQSPYTQLPIEFKNRKQSFLDFLGGNFQEINTLISEISPLGNVSVLLYVKRDLFIPGNQEISPAEIVRGKIVEKSFNPNKWIDRNEAVIISLNIKKTKDFFGSYGNRIRKTCIVTTGKSVINELSRQYQAGFMFLERKGVARFGVENRRKISELLRSVI